MAKPTCSSAAPLASHSQNPAGGQAATPHGWMIRAPTHSRPICASWKRLSRGHSSWRTSLASPTPAKTRDCATCSTKSPLSTGALAPTTPPTTPSCALPTLACRSFASASFWWPHATGARLRSPNRAFANVTPKRKRRFFPARPRCRPTGRHGTLLATCPRFPTMKTSRCAGVGPSCFRQFPRVKITCGTRIAAVAGRSSDGGAAFGISSSSSQKIARHGRFRRSRDRRLGRFTGTTAASASASCAASRHFLTTSLSQATTLPHTNKSATPCHRCLPKSSVEKSARIF